MIIKHSSLKLFLPKLISSKVLFIGKISLKDLIHSFVNLFPYKFKFFKIDFGFFNPSKILIAFSSPILSPLKHKYLDFE